MPGKYGDVGRLVTERSDVTFMVVAVAADEHIRRGMSDYREAIVIAGEGYDRERRVVGDIGAVRVNDPRIEWLDFA